MKPRPNPGGPPPKAEYSLPTDSAQVPRGKGEKNPGRGVKENLKPSVRKLREPPGATACLLHNEPASCPQGRGQAIGGAEAKASANSANSPCGQTRSRVIYPWSGRTSGNAERRAEPVGVEKPLDELWMGAKDQSNPVIAGSLRNSFGASPGHIRTGVERPFSGGAPPGCQCWPNSEYRPSAARESDRGG